MTHTLISVPEKTMTYDEYIRKVTTLVNEKATSGTNQSESLVNYTYLNFRRMTRLNKTVKIDADLSKMVRDYGKTMHWVVITEAWCGDAAQNIPYIAKLAETVPNVELELVYRDQNSDFMDGYLTNGARSIPKFIGFDRESGEELFVWGPRPEPVQQMVMEYKDLLDHEKLPFDQFAERIHGWYAKDKNETLRTELLHIFRSLQSQNQSK